MSFACAVSCRLFLGDKDVNVSRRLLHVNGRSEFGVADRLRVSRVWTREKSKFDCDGWSSKRGGARKKALSQSSSQRGR